MLAIDKHSRTPIYEQIVRSVEREIVTGLLKPNDKLPSVRELSVLLDANPNTIQKAFTELDRAGVIVSYPGRGCFVSDDAPSVIRAKMSEKLAEIRTACAMLCRAGIDRETVLSAVYEGYAAAIDQQGKEGSMT